MLTGTSTLESLPLSKLQEFYLKKMSKSQKSIDITNIQTKLQKIENPLKLQRLKVIIIE